MISLALHTIRTTRLQRLVFSESSSPFTSVFHLCRYSGRNTRIRGYFLLRGPRVLCGSFSHLAAAKGSSAAPNCSSNPPNCSSNLPKCSRSAQLEPFPGEPIFTTLSRQTPYNFAPEKSPPNLSASPWLGRPTLRILIRIRWHDQVAI